ncbi:MAG: hypothetical protein E7214_15075 [Clostridium sp.]|nr:hypothetical protein [Clostridium sp.]
MIEKRGYGIINKLNGDIPQLAVSKKHRNEGIGTNILLELLKATNSKGVTVLNVDSKCLTIKKILNRCNFENYVNQYEMILKL